MTKGQLEKGEILQREINYSGGNYLMRVGSLGDGYIGEAVNYLCCNDKVFEAEFKKLASDTNKRLVEEFKNL